MKITDITTTILHDPDRRAIRDSTIIGAWEGGATSIFIHIKTDEGLSLIHISEPTRPY